MGLLSRFGGLFGRRPKSPERGPSANNSRDRTSVTAELNHRIGAIDRGDRYEEPLEKALAERGYGEVDGGGTMQSKEGEIEWIDIHMFLDSPEIGVPFVIQFLEDRGAPKGSKLKIFVDDEASREVPFGVREGFAIYLDGVNLPDEVYRTSERRCQRDQQAHRRAW